MFRILTYIILAYVALIASIVAAILMAKYDPEAFRYVYLRIFLSALSFQPPAVLIFSPTLSAFVLDAFSYALEYH